MKTFLQIAINHRAESFRIAGTTDWHVFNGDGQVALESDPTVLVNYTADEYASREFEIKTNDRADEVEADLIEARDAGQLRPYLRAFIGLVAELMPPDQLQQARALGRDAAGLDPI